MEHSSADDIGVVRVTASNFRGLKQGSISFVDNLEQPQSALILGDNGSGKSSLLDAVSFGVTGNLPALTEANRTIRITPRYHLADDGDPTSVEVTLSDGRVARSSLEQRNRMIEFQRVAVIVKRDQLLAFARGSAEQRGGLLRQIVDTRHLPKDGPGDAEIALERERNSIQADVVRLNAQLRARLRLPVEARHHELSGRDIEILRTAHPITRKKVNRSKRKKRGVNELVDLGERLQQAVDQRERLSTELSQAKRYRQRKRVIDVLLAASERLNTSFHRIAHEDVRQIVSRIELVQQGASGHIDLSVVLSNNVRVAASTVLSEASLDLAALLAFIALIRDGAERGQAKVLILDDIFQSVDGLMRERLAEYLFEEMRGWQLIIAFHDRIWFERFSDIARRSNFPHVRRRVWRGATGETCVSEGYHTSREYLVEQMSSGNFSIVPTIAGRVLEELCETLSMSMKCVVRRTDGDKYTLGDLIPGIKERFRNSSSITAHLNRLDETRHLRNLVGAHSTSWAEGFSDSESREFGQAVLGLYDEVVCLSCRTTLRHKNSSISCRCGGLIAT